MQTFRTRFSARIPVLVKCTAEEGRTKSEFMDDVDINKIIQRYKRTGNLPDSTRLALKRYEDVSEVTDYHQLYDRLHAAQDAFQSLPAAVRKKFNNDPGQFLAALDTKEGQDILVEAGLASRNVPNSPPEVPPAPVPDAVKPKA